MPGARDAAAPWDGRLYAANTAHHRAFDAHILGPVAFAPGWHVLDVGCGVGDLTARLAGLVPEGRVLGVDASVEQLDVARRRHPLPNLAFAVADARSLRSLVGEGLATPASFDLVLSVAVLHWVPAADLPGVLREMLALLRPGGTLRLDFGGEGQIADARVVLDRVAAAHGGPQSPWHYPPPGPVAQELEAAGFDLAEGWVRLAEQRRSVPDTDALAGWLDSQVLNAYTARMDAAGARAFRADALDACRRELQRSDGTYDQCYVRLDVLAHAPR